MMKNTLAAALVACVALSGGLACGGEQPENRLTNPSFQEGDDGSTPPGWAGKSFGLSREPYGPDANESSPNDKLCFVRRNGGRPPTPEEQPANGMGVLCVMGQDKWSMGFQAVEVNLGKPTRFTFSVYVRSDQTAPAADQSAYISVRGLKLEKDTGFWKKQSTVGGVAQSAMFTATPRWRKVTVSTVYPAGIERIRVDIGSYSRDIAIEVDNATLTWGPAVHEFDVEGEAADLAQLLADAGDESEDAAELKELFATIEDLLSRARSEDTSAKDKAQAAQKLPQLIADYFKRKDALKASLLDSLFD